MQIEEMIENHEAEIAEKDEKIRELSRKLQISEDIRIAEKKILIQEIEKNKQLQAKIEKYKEVVDDLWIHHWQDGDNVIIPDCEFYLAMERVGYKIK